MKQKKVSKFYFTIYKFLIIKWEWLTYFLFYIFVRRRRKEKNLGLYLAKKIFIKRICINNIHNNNMRDLTCTLEQIQAHLSLIKRRKYNYNHLNNLNSPRMPDHQACMITNKYNHIIQGQGLMILAIIIRKIRCKGQWYKFLGRIDRRSWGIDSKHNQMIH